MRQKIMIEGAFGMSLGENDLQKLFSHFFQKVIAPKNFAAIFCAPFPGHGFERAAHRQADN